MAMCRVESAADPEAVVHGRQGERPVLTEDAGRGAFNDWLAPRTAPIRQAKERAEQGICGLRVLERCPVAHAL